MTTEAQLWQRIKPQIVKAGGLPIRLENAANMSVPDVAIVLNSTTVWVELKQVHGKQISVGKFQAAFGHKLSQVLRPELFWVMAAMGNSTVAWPYVEVIKAFKKWPSFEGSPLVFNVGDIAPYYIVDWPHWLHEIENGTLLAEEREETYGYPV